jgi:tetratricopeptide (TPR) repeat protein
MLPAKAFDLANQYADKALQLDSSVAGGYVAKGSVYLLYQWKWKEAYEALQTALQLNPAIVDTYQLLSYYYILMGQKDEAVKIMEEAEQLDPLSTIVSYTLGNMYVFALRFDDAIRQAEKLLEIDPRMRAAIELKGWAIGMKGDWEAALTLFDEVHRLTNHPLKGLMGLGFASAKLGNREKAMDVIHKMEQRQLEEPDSVIDGDLAAVWYGLGNLDKTFYYLNECVDKRMGPVSYILEYPAYIGAKDDPRYEELRKKIGV